MERYLYYFGNLNRKLLFYSVELDGSLSASLKRKAEFCSPWDSIM